MSSRVGVGIIGCGNISPAYLQSALAFPILSIQALADTDTAAARARGEQFSVPVASVEELLADPAIEIVLNLTTPQSHVEVGLRALAAGKHVYSEKPLGVDTAQARQLLESAEARERRVGCGPASFLAAIHQTCRRMIDRGAIGAPIGGTAFFMCPGHEHWHPSPAFYYLRGGGPMLDMGPYYITVLVNLLGPIARVAAMAIQPHATRTIGSSPLRGTVIAVEVPTHVAGTLHFHCGAIVSLTMSFDVPRHRHTPLEIYGTEGSLLVPDPDLFDGEIQHATSSGEWIVVHSEPEADDQSSRAIGLADMAQAIRARRPHLASGVLAFHVLEVIEAFHRSSDSGRFIEIESRPRQPAALPVNAQH
jgi:predicted dehydrogenase